MPERELRKNRERPTCLFSTDGIWPESCHSVFMILLVTPSEKASECSAALHAATGEPVMIAENLARATTQLRAQCCRVVVLDQYLLEAQPEQAAAMIDHLGTAIPVHVNLAISGLERLVRDIRMAVERRQREELRASQAAIRKLQCELNDTITALLLSTELARETPGLPPAAAAKLESVHGLVKRLREQLETSHQTEEAKYAVG